MPPRAVPLLSATVAIAGVAATMVPATMSRPMPLAAARILVSRLRPVAMRLVVSRGVSVAAVVVAAAITAIVRARLVRQVDRTRILHRGLQRDGQRRAGRKNQSAPEHLRFSSITIEPNGVGRSTALRNLMRCVKITRETLK